MTIATEAGTPPAGPTIPVRLLVNGRPYDLALDPRTSLLDVPARAPAPDRHQERLQPTAPAAPARSWLTANGLTPA
ncbi:MAG: hypothetical protein WKG07_02115 [Hymenobacter sp.]